MPTKRIAPTAAAFVADVCRHLDHNPNPNITLAPGTYQHTCEGCGRTFVFTVSEKARLG